MAAELIDPGSVEDAIIHDRDLDDYGRQRAMESLRRAREESTKREIAVATDALARTRGRVGAVHERAAVMSALLREVEETDEKNEDQLKAARHFTVELADARQQILEVEDETAAATARLERARRKLVKLQGAPSVSARAEEDHVVEAIINSELDGLISKTNLPAANLDTVFDMVKQMMERMNELEAKVEETKTKKD